MRTVLHLAVAALILSGTTLRAETPSSYGASWNTVYGFNSASDRSVALQQAEAIRSAEQGPVTPVYNTYYDNRSGYIEVNSAGGDVTGSSQIGNTIGEQTYSVGALNTGSTTITVKGSGNTVDAVNTATSNGCVDGSILHSDLVNGLENSAMTPSDTTPGVVVTDPGQYSKTCTQ